MLSALGRVFRRDVSGDTARGVAVKNGNGNIAALLPPDVGGDDSVSPGAAGAYQRDKTSCMHSISNQDVLYSVECSARNPYFIKGTGKRF